MGWMPSARTDGERWVDGWMVDRRVNYIQPVKSDGW